ncbi:NAD(P)-binding domain [Penicillium roqueforti FM164]|uniref:NAD(P)-binding domain n=1 Tax=Penicillium roqueforti (strain FM164) TaxID=1365484 RepID=W6Q565_PENRF|nr:NAD(P)-binding domain [Penicillium roqueforti FM164]
MFLSRLPSVVTFWLAVAITGNTFDPKNYAKADVLVCDVAVVGGGSSGTYAAINLRKMGQSVVVVERKKHLGGHTNTYTDKATGLTVDYGVQSFLNSSIALDYFAHFNISLVKYTESNATISLTDFNTGNPVLFNPSRNLTGWAIQVAQYPWLDSTWEIPQPVPPDLLLPLGDFLVKYNISDAAFNIYFSSQGISNPLQQLTVNVMKMVDAAYLREIAGARLNAADKNNSELYVKSLAELGSDALISSTVTAAARPQTGRGVSLVVKTTTGFKLVQASKLLVNIPPTLENMRPFNFNLQELQMFSHIRIPGVFYVWYRSPSHMTRLAVEQATIRAIQNLQEAQNVTITTPQIINLNSHTPFKLSVSAQAIRDGFYNDLYALQGKRSTWYTGAALISHNGGVLWKFTQALLPRIVAA